jgi:hypothetical protein
MSSKRPARGSALEAASQSCAGRAVSAGLRAFTERYFVAPVAFVVATSLILLLQAPPSHGFYILWCSVILIGASHGAIGQGLAAGVLSSILIRYLGGNSLVAAPADPGGVAQAFAFLVFAVWAGRLNAVRVRGMKAANSKARRR